MYQDTRVVGDADTLLRHHLIREETQWNHNAINVLAEDAKHKLTDNIVTKLFKDIKAKSMSVDFSEIDASKGNINNFKNYSAINNAINYLDSIANNATKTQELKPVVAELKFALSTLKKHSRQFELSFKLNNSVIKYLYDSIVVALIQGTSFVVAESVEFVKDNLNLYKAEAKHSNHIMKNIHIKSIISFNQMERKSQLTKLFSDTQQFKESAIADVGKNVLNHLDKFNKVGKVIAVLGLIGFALTFIRASIFAYYNSRVKLSQYLKHLKEFVLMNSSTMDADARRVKEKQEKVAQMLDKLSDIISVDQNVSNDRANSQLEDSNKVIALDNKTPKDDNTVDLGLF